MTNIKEMTSRICAMFTTIGRKSAYTEKDRAKKKSTMRFYRVMEGTSRDAHDERQHDKKEE